MSSASLSDLDAFVAVARARGFRGAAVARGVSPSSLSAAVRRLEARMGVRLLNRTTRSVTPTEAGERLMERLAPVLAEVEGALDAVNAFRDSPTGTLRLSVPSAVARVILPPIITPFLALHPGVALEVSADDTFIDVVAGGFDARIRYDERLERDMIAVPIGPRVQRFVTAAAPSYLARHGRPEHPDDVLKHAALRHRFASGHMPIWEFEKDGEIVKVRPEGRIIASSIDLKVAAAEAGLGLIHSFDQLLKPSIEAGRLVPVLEDWEQEFPGPRLYFPSRRLMPAPLRAFVDFVKAENS